MSEFDTIKKQEMIDALAELKDTLPLTIEVSLLQAQTRKASYDALVSEGFTEKQALQIVQTSVANGLL